jgi:hypothetical protein
MTDNKRIKLGFIVNIANPLNMDVDFGLTDEELEYYKLQNVEYINYSYTDDDYGDLTIGKAYRVRMEGITTKNFPNIKRYTKLQSRLLCEIVRFLDRTGGFVKYRITGIDIFGRAIVILCDPVSGESINDIILNQKYSLIYCNYSRNNEKIEEKKEKISNNLKKSKKDAWRLKK